MNTTPKAVLLSCITTAGRVLHASNADADTVLALARELADAVHDVPENTVPAPDRGRVAMDNALVVHYQNDGIVRAIKHCRAVTGLGLREAKEYVEQLLRREGLR